MIAPADIDEFDAAVGKRIMGAEVTTGLHDGKPLQVEIVNPQEIGRRDQVIRIQRDSDGPMQSATAHQV